MQRIQTYLIHPIILCIQPYRMLDLVKAWLDHTLEMNQQVKK